MQPLKLSSSTQGRLFPDIAVPTYERWKLPPSIVHIGVGGFHRAHQAVYLDDAIRRTGDLRWGLSGVGLLEQDRRMHDALTAQDYLYTLVERSARDDRASVIGSIVDYQLAPDGPQAVIEAMAAPECRIFSLTITEGGYYINQGTGAFEDQHPDIRHDLAHPDRPACSFGFLAEALDRRRRRGLPPSR